MRGLIVPIALLVTALAAPALATPTDDVKNAFIGFGQLTSYHFAVEANGKSGEGDVVVPDKMQMTFGPTKIIHIGTSTWVFVGGHWMQMPGTADSMGRMTGGLSAAQSYAANPKDITVTDLGTKSVDGETLHLYSVQNKGNSTPEHGVRRKRRPGPSHRHRIARKSLDRALLDVQRVDHDRGAAVVRQ